jgi:hypothetical protein
MIEVELPDGTIAEFPDGTPSETINGALQKRFAPRVDPATNQPPGVPAFQPPGVEGYNPQTGEVARQPRSMLASAAHGAADVGTFGFGDEIASSLVGQFSGVPREQVLREMRGIQRQAQSDNPGSYLTGQIGGAVAQGAGLVAGGLSPAAHAINAGWRLPGVMAASGVEGGALGALHGAGAGETADERLSGAAWGGGLGLGMGAAAPAVVQGVSSAARRAITPFSTSPERVAAAQTLRSEGIPLTAGQMTGNRSLRFSESELGGRRAANIMDEQKDAFTKAILGRAGVNASRATPEVMDDAFRTIGRQFDDLASSNRLLPDGQMIQDLRTVFNEYGSMVPESMRAPIVQSVTNDIVEAARRGPISGEAYQNITSRIAKAARGSSNPDLKQTLYGIRSSMDDAMERSIAATNPSQAGAWRTAREQYRNLLAVEQAATRAGEAAAEGIISPANIRNAAINQGRRAYARGQGDFADLARAGSMLLSPLPDSGTAGRLKAQNLAAFGPMVGGAVIGGGAGAYQSGDMTGALAGAALGAAAPRVAGRALMSRPVQSYLSNQAMSGVPDPIKQAIMNAILTGNTSAFAHHLAP